MQICDIHILMMKKPKCFRLINGSAEPVAGDVHLNYW